MIIDAGARLGNLFRLTRRVNRSLSLFGFLDCRVGCGPATTTLLIEGFAASIALDIHLQDRGVMDESIDGRERHGLVPDQCKTPLSLMDWCLKFGLFPPVTLCLTRSYPCSPCGQLEGRSLCW